MDYLNRLISEWDEEYHDYYSRMAKKIEEQIGVNLTTEELWKLLCWFDRYNGDLSALKGWETIG